MRRRVGVKAMRRICGILPYKEKDVLDEQVKDTVNLIVAHGTMHTEMPANHSTVQTAKCTGEEACREGGYLLVSHLTGGVGVGCQGKPFRSFFYHGSPSPSRWQQTQVVAENIATYIGSGTKVDMLT